MTPTEPSRAAGRTPVRSVAASDHSARGSEERRDEAEERLARILRLALPVVIALGAVVGGIVLGPGIAILVLAAGALIAALAAMWSSLRALVGESRITGEDALAMGAPSAEEEQKRAVLRAMKDLEFERGVGKISEQDYDLLIAKYRVDAKRLLRVLDERAAPGRSQVEGMVEAHLAGLGLESGWSDEEERGSEGEASKEDA